MASAKGHFEAAARLLGAAEAQQEILGHRFGPPERGDHDQRVASGRAALRDATFVAALAEGRALTLEQAIEYALADQTG